MKKIFILMVVVLLAWGCHTASSQVDDPNNNNNNTTDNTGDTNDTGDTTTAATFTISGTITGAAASGAKVTLSGTASDETTTDADGKYSFDDLSAGDYTITPSKDNSAFNPSNQSVTLAADSANNFSSAAYQSASIKNSALSGTVNKCFTSDDFATGTSGIAGKELAAGDCFGDDRLNRTFFNFDLSGIGASSTIVSATLSFSQTSTGTPYTGNSLTIDHVNYETSLDTGDWDTTALTSSVATNSTATDGVITIPTALKDVVQSDVSVRRQTQLRLSFPDAIAANNYITIVLGSDETNPPTLNVTYYQF